jgi:hypothetical protein
MRAVMKGYPPKFWISTLAVGLKFMLYLELWISTLRNPKYAGKIGTVYFQNPSVYPEPQFGGPLHAEDQNAGRRKDGGAFTVK